MPWFWNAHCCLIGCSYSTLHFDWHKQLEKLAGGSANASAAHTHARTHTHTHTYAIVMTLVCIFNHWQATGRKYWAQIVVTEFVQVVHMLDLIVPKNAGVEKSQSEQVENLQAGIYCSQLVFPVASSQLQPTHHLHHRGKSTKQVKWQLAFLPSYCT